MAPAVRRSTLRRLGIVAAVCLSVGAVLAPPAAAQSFTAELVPSSLVENGRPVSLEFVTYAPPGPGPFPTVVFHHGSTGSGTDPALFTQTWHSPTIATWFTARGWQVVFPQRRGRGRSDGLYDEGFAPNRAAGYTCEPARSLAGLERALVDADEIARLLALRPSVDSRRLLVAGQSRGGILAVVHAGVRPDLYLGALNFVGGWMSDGCPNPTAINTVSFARGGAFPGPTAWIYGENDPFYSLAHSRTNHAAFAAAGGRGAFTTLALGPGQNGHNAFLFPGLWGPVVEDLLRRLPAPVAAPGAATLTNLSLRAPLAGAPLIIGFVIGGNTPRPLLVRGLGPALERFGLHPAAERPSLTLFDREARPVAEIGAWAGHADLAATFAAAGAFPLAADSADAAAVLELPPGAYTLHLRDAASDPRLALGEIFAVDPSGRAAGLANLSARVDLGSGDATAIAGFVVGGAAPAPVLVRVAGPALAAFGIANPAADPQLALFDSAGRLVAANDDWPAELAASAAAVGAFAFPAGSRDAAVRLDLPPGAYTVHATGAGPALIELYSVARPD